jgi:hypothetical protein
MLQLEGIAKNAPGVTGITGITSALSKQQIEPQSMGNQMYQNASDDASNYHLWIGGFRHMATKTNKF